MIQERTTKQSSLYEQALAEILEEDLGDDIDELCEGARKSDVLASLVSMIRHGELVLRWEWDPESGRHRLETYWPSLWRDEE